MTSTSGPPSTPTVQAEEATGTDGRAWDVLTEVLDYSRARDYVGWDLYDGESSRLLEALPLDNQWVNLSVQQAVRRSAVNVRPALLVEQRRSFLGAALFTLANLTAHELSDDDRYRNDAVELADWLVESRSSGYAGYCGGHQHPLQRFDGRTMPEDPDVVTTSHATKALLAAGERLDESYQETAATAADFVLENLGYDDCESGARIHYHPDESGDNYTLNANALGARLLLDVSAATGDDDLAAKAEPILDYVAANQADIGGWTYRDPPDASHLSMDNFHNGFIIQSFLRHAAVRDSDRFADTIERAVAFYRDELFTYGGAPNFDESSAYPRDVHCAAQGIAVFSTVGDGEFARRILGWTLDNLYDGNGAFYHEKGRFFTKRITYMRWCQAWMAWALTIYLAREHDLDGFSATV